MVGVINLLFLHDLSSLFTVDVCVYTLELDSAFVSVSTTALYRLSLPKHKKEIHTEGTSYLGCSFLDLS